MHVSDLEQELVISDVELLYCQNVGNICLGLLDAGIMGKDASNIIGGKRFFRLFVISLLLESLHCNRMFHELFFRYLDARDLDGIR
jgi:hypothetical protein